MKILKLAGIEQTEEFFKNAYEKKEIFFFKYRKAYQLHWSKNAGYYMNEFLYLRKDASNTSFTKRGRFVNYNSKDANDLIQNSFV